MKKLYIKSMLMVSIAALLHANSFAGSPPKTDLGKKNDANSLRSSGPVKAPSILTFGPDVIIKPASENQSDIKIATAFNGWNYAVYNAHGGSGDGIYVLQSRDHGQTWNVLFSYTSYYRYGADIAVCGTDTSSLDLYITSIDYDSGTGDYYVWVDKYKGNDGTFLTQLVNETLTDTVYDVALALDFLHPAIGSGPYSVETIFSMYGSPQDSVIAYLSTDGGNTVSRRGVDGSSRYFGKVSVCYGYSPSRNDGRYFVAYEEHSFGSTEGDIKECFTTSFITDPFTAPTYLDSLGGASWSNRAWGPSISAQNSGTDNDSLGVTVAVAWTHNYNGSGDIDAIGAFSYDPPIGSAFQILELDYLSSTHSQQPNLNFDQTNNNFLATFWDSTDNALKYFVQSINMPTPTAWTVISAQYNDQVGTMTNPHPCVVIDPTFTMADLAWIESRGGFDQALFDAENSMVGISEHNPNQFSLNQNYPNPANEYTVISFDLDKPQQVSLEVYDLVGNKIATLENNSVSAGSHQVKMNLTQVPAGYYLYTLKAGNESQSKKLLVVH